MDPLWEGLGGLGRNWRKGKVGQGPRAGARRKPSSWTLRAVVTWGEPGSFSEGADNVGVLTHCLLFLREAFFQDFLPFGLSPTPHPRHGGAAIAVRTGDMKTLEGLGLGSRLGAPDGEQRLFLHPPPFLFLWPPADSAPLRLGGERAPKKLRGSG